MIFKNLFGKRSEEDILGYLGDEESGSSDISDPEVQAMRVRARGFSAFNKRKIATILSKLRDLDQDIFRMLPFLVHLNVEGLPGYVAEAGRQHGGIADCQVDPDTFRLLQRHFPDAKLSPQTIRPPKAKDRIIHSLASMGSLATIAQTAKSDFDIWVCAHKSEFPPEALEALAFKLKEIEEWAERKNRFETHFFITDITEARNNHFGASDSESAGSALGKLLKEEFFRTHTVLAGYPPLWTIMPPQVTDEDYGRLRELAKKDFQIDVRRFIDLGPAQRVTMEEAFGAALWQLNKALGSPFKSAMKMSLIEDYMDPESDPMLLCDRLKQAISEAAGKPTRRGDVDSLGADCLLDAHPKRFELDGYLLMFQRILAYYRKKGKGDLEEILRKCFYLKAGDRIAGINDPNRSKSAKKDMLAILVEGWGWENEQILHLNRFKEWSFDQCVTLGKQVNGFIIDSYKRLSQSGATSQVRINPTDLTVLGRKLFTFYSKKDNKIDFLPRIFDDSLHQEHLTFSYVAGGPGTEPLWRVHRDQISPAGMAEPATAAKALRQTRNLASLLGWLVINEIWGRSTHVSLASKDSPVTVADLQDLLGGILDFFPHINVGHLSNQQLLNEAKMEKVFAVLNLAENKLSERVTRLHLLYETTWGEVFCEAHNQSDITSTLCACLRVMPRGRKSLQQAFKVLVPSGKAGVSNRATYVDFEALVHEAAGFFYGTPLPERTVRSFVFQGERMLSVVSWGGGEIRSEYFPAFDEFYQKRETGKFQHSEIRVASSPTKLLPQQLMSANLKPNTLQAIVYDDGLKARIYISDEMGGTMFIPLSTKSWMPYVAKLAGFMGSAARRLAEEPSRAALKLPPPGVGVCYVGPKGANRPGYKVEDVTEAVLAAQSSTPPEVLSVTEETDGGGKQAVVIRAGGRTFSSTDHGADLFRAVASHIYEARQRNSKNPIFIADCTLPGSFRQKFCPEGAKGTHYLAYRKLIEGKLYQALQAL
ncbi:MAG: class I adenylate cyclase [Nitrospinota bacterium]